MKAGLALASLCLGPGLLAQTPDAEAIPTAIGRLRGERTDHEALGALIDAGDAAVDPLLAALESALAQDRDEQARRILRVLRAIGEPAARRSPVLMQLFGANIQETGGRSTAVRLDLTRTLAKLVWLAPAEMPKLRETVDELYEANKFFLLTGGNDQHRLLRRLSIAADPQDPTRPEATLAAPDLMDRELAAELAWRDGETVVPALVAAIEGGDHPTESKISYRNLGTAISVPGQLADEMIRGAAARSLARIAPDHPAALLGHCLLTRGADAPRTRVAAVMALARRGDSIRDEVEVLEALRSILDDDVPDDLLAEAITACGTIGLRDDQIRNRLEVLSNDPRTGIAKRAASVLRTWN